MNELRPQGVDVADLECRQVEGWKRVRQGYVQYLEDESRMAAKRVEVIHFPATLQEVAAAVRHVCAANHRVAVSGARTGITGAAVPLDAEEVISLDYLKGTPIVQPDGQGGWKVRVAAGTTVDELADALSHGLCEYPDGKPDRPVYYPVDTTETSAHLGGTVSTNASGARTLYYGPTRDQVLGLAVVTADGRILQLKRGEVRAENGKFVYVGPDGSRKAIPVADLPLPSTKHTAGYHLKSGMDAVDLFVGSEGTLGIIAEAELKLSPVPANRLFMTQFVNGENPVVEAVLQIKAHESLCPLALEYIGPRALGLLRQQGRQTPAYMEVSRLPDYARAALYVELPFDREDDLDAAYAALQEVFGALDHSVEHSWAGFTARDMDEMKRLRHAVPESVNAIIGQRKRNVPELHKVGTDMAVPDGGLAQMMGFYRSQLDESGLEYVIFGHIGSGHVHVNILPESLDQLEQAEELYLRFAEQAVRLGGSVAAEHGIGRIKKMFLPIQYSRSQIAAMEAVKHALDPEGILNPGVLFG